MISIASYKLLFIYALVGFVTHFEPHKQWKAFRNVIQSKSSTDTLLSNVDFFPSNGSIIVNYQVNCKLAPIVCWRNPELDYVTAQVGFLHPFDSEINRFFGNPMYLDFFYNYLQDYSRAPKPATKELTELHNAWELLWSKLWIMKFHQSANQLDSTTAHNVSIEAEEFRHWIYDYLILFVHFQKRCKAIDFLVYEHFKRQIKSSTVLENWHNFMAQFV